MRMFFLLAFLMVQSSLCLASPFMTCDPNPVAISGKYEVREVTPGNSDGVLAFSVPSEQDGSMIVDVNSLERGVHTYKIIYIVWNIPSTPIHCTITVTINESKSVTKKLSTYSFTKTWTLSSPASNIKMSN